MKCISNIVRKKHIFVTWCLIVSLFKQGGRSEVPCSIEEGFSGLCYFCNPNYFNENYINKRTITFPATDCKLKTITENKNLLNVFVYFDGNCGQNSCDGSLDRPFLRIEEAFKLINYYASKQTELESNLILFSKGVDVFFWLSGEPTEFFRRSKLKLKIKPGYCDEYQGNDGCIESSKNIRIIIKSPGLRIYVSREITLENLTIDARDLVLPDTHPCISLKENRTCCDDNRIESLYDEKENNCAVYNRIIEIKGEGALFNVEMIHDNEEVLLPVLIMRNVSIQNFWPFGKAFRSLFSLVKGLQGNFILSYVQLRNITLGSGIISTNNQVIFGDKAFSLKPIRNIEPGTITSSFEELMIFNYNTVGMTLNINDNLLDFAGFQGIISLKNITLKNINFFDGCIINFKEAKNAMGREIIIDGLTLTQSSARYFLILELGIYSSISKAVFHNNHVVIFIFADSVYNLAFSEISFSGSLPEYAFAAIADVQVYANKCTFYQLIQSSVQAKPILFLSVSDYPITLTDQFFDGDFNRTFTAKDVFVIMNSNISDSSSEFSFLSCLHSVLEVRIKSLFFFNIISVKSNNAFLSVAPERSFSIENSTFNALIMSSTLIKLQPCIRLFMSKVNFTNIEIYNNPLLKFESRTNVNKLTHIFTLEGVTLDNINMIFSDNQNLELYVIFNEYRTMGDGGKFSLTDSKIKNVHFGNDFSTSILLAISGVQLVFKNITIWDVSNSTILFYSITDKGSSCEISNVMLTNKRFPIFMFLNTQKEFIDHASVTNCTIIASIVKGRSLIVFNNVKVFLMLKNYFKAAVIQGSLLILEAESDEDLIIDENIFEGVPELVDTQTIGIIYGTSSIQKHPVPENKVHGIKNILFKNLLSSALVILEESHISLSNASFLNISVFKDDLIFIKSKTMAIFSYIWVEAFSAHFQGSALNIFNSVLMINNGLFNICESNYGEGGIFLGIGSEISIIKVVFTNVLALTGALILNDNCNFSLKAVFSLNTTALSSGGGIFSTFGSFAIEDTTFAESRASANGGCLFIESSLLYLKNISFRNCNAEDIGVVLVFNSFSSPSLMQNVSFISNRAKNLPSFGIYDSIMIASELLIFNNSGDSDGSIIEVYSFFSNCSLILNKTTFRSNEIFEKGSLLTITGSKFVFQNSDILEFKVPTFILFDSGSEGLILSSALKAITPDQKLLNTTLLIIKKSNLIVDQSLLSRGQAISSLSCSIIDLKFTTFKDCFSKESPLVFKRSLTINILSCIFDSNYGLINGALYVENIGKFSAKLSFFIGNKCELDGCSTALFIKNDFISTEEAVIDLFELFFINLEKVSIIVFSKAVIFVQNSIFFGSLKSPSQAIKVYSVPLVLVKNSFVLNHIGLGAISIEAVFEMPSASLKLSDMIIHGPSVFIQNTTFFNCSNINSGGAIFTLGSISLRVRASIFSMCSSNESGGSIFYSCDGEGCELEVINSNLFSNSKAKLTGGAIKILSKNYVVSNDTLFYQTVAMIGNVVSTKPSKLNILIFEKENEYYNFVKNASVDTYPFEETSINISLAIGHEVNLGLFVFDSFDNHLDTVNGVIVKTRISKMVNSLTGTPILSNDINLFIKSGSGKIENGSCLLRINFFSDKADIELDLIAYALIDSLDINNTIKIKITRCPRGEIYLFNRCFMCEENFFSLEEDAFSNNLSSCEKCAENAICPGGDKLFPLSGYWRYNNATKIISKCKYELACAYPKVSDEFNGTVCSNGYTGNICYYCEEGFGKSLDSCTECFRTIFFWIIFLTGLAIVMLLIFYTKKTILNDSQSSGLVEKEGKLMLKLLFNHFSYLSITFLFDENWKDNVVSTFNFANSSINSSPRNIFVLDCFFQAPHLEKYKKSFIFTISSPVLVTVLGYLVSFLLELIIAAIRSNTNHRSLLKPVIMNYFTNKKFILLELEALFIIISLNFYPTLLMKPLEIFGCVELLEGVTFIKKNPDLRCWQEEHFLFIKLSISFLLLWGLGIPLYFFYKSREAVKVLQNKVNKVNRPFPQKDCSAPSLSKNTHKFRVAKVAIRFTDYKNTQLNEQHSVNLSPIEHGRKNLNLFLTSGYKPNFYYWEAIMFMKKALVLFSFLLIKFMDKRSLTALVILIFFSFFFMNEKWSIYQSPLVKKFEGISLVIAIVTVSLTLFASEDNITGVSKYVSQVIVTILNLGFSLIWLKAFFLKMNTTRKRDQCPDVARTTKKKSSLLAKIKTNSKRGVELIVRLFKLF